MSEVQNVPYTFEQTVHWSGLDGSKTSWTTEGSDLHMVRVTAFRNAAHCGWKPKRWWQWWRWDDTPNPSAEVMEAIREKLG